MGAIDEASGFRWEKGVEMKRGLPLGLARLFQRLGAVHDR